MSVTMIGIRRGAHTSSTGPATQMASRQRQRGNVLLEQALVLPVMMLLMFGVIDMARALYAYHYVSYIAREATRWASVRSGPLNGPVSDAQVGNFVKDVTGMGLDGTRFTTTVGYLRPPSGTPLCPVAGDSHVNQKPGCIVQVTVKYQFKFVVPIMPAGFQMSSESQMIITQ
jgi:Flp pilus assembly protein TadG